MMESLRLLCYCQLLRELAGPPPCSLKLSCITQNEIFFCTLLNVFAFWAQTLYVVWLDLFIDCH